MCEHAAESPYEKLSVNKLCVDQVQMQLLHPAVKDFSSRVSSPSKKTRLQPQTPCNEQWFVCDVPAEVVSALRPPSSKLERVHPDVKATKGNTSSKDASHSECSRLF